MLHSQLPIIARRDLLDIVKARPNVRIILISAPTGYGKSVLASQIAEAIDAEFVTHRISIWQRDIKVLHQNAIDAFSTLKSDIAMPDRVISENSIIHLAQYLENTHERITYIIDDLHHIVDFQKVEQWLQQLLDYLPQNMTLILCGRQIPPLNWAPFVHRNEILAFGIDKLALNVDVLAESVSDLPHLKAQELVSQFNGWIAGIKLALMIPEGQIIDDDNPLEPQQLFQDLLVTTFQAEPPDFQSFLMLSSTLETINKISCRDILGLQNVDHHLDRLYSQQLFVRSSEHGLEYHDLFRAFLQSHLKRYDEDLYLQSHRRVAEWHHSQDQIKVAITHYIDAKRLDDAAALAKYVAHSYLIEGQKETLLHFYHLLKQHSPPELLLHCGIIYMERRDFSQSETLLNIAHTQFMKQDNQAQAMRASIELAFNTYRSGDYQTTLKRLETLVIPYPDMLVRCTRLQGLTYLELGQFDLAIQYLEQAANSLAVSDAKFVRSNVLQDLSEAYLRTGNFEQAGNVLQDAVALKRDIGNTDDLALALNNLGHYWYRAAAYDDAIATLENGLDIVSTTEARATSYLYWSLADVYRTIGMAADAERYYNTARKLAGDEEYLYIGVMLSFAMMRCMQGYWHDADHILNHIVQTDKSSTQSTMLKLLKSAVNAMIHHDAYEDLNIAIVELDQQGARLKLADALGIYLLVSWQSGRSDMMDRGIRLLKSLNTTFWGSVAGFIVNFPELKRYLFTVKGLQTLQSYCDNLQKQQPDNTTSSIFDTTHSDLSIYTLGQDHFILDGDKVTKWTVAFARELFLYLYLNDRKTRNDLKDEFWSDRDVEQAMASFHTTRNRIRNALGKHAIAYEDQYYKINEAFNITVDCVQFENYVHRSHQLPLNDARSEDLLNRAIRLYRGDFLPHFDRDWVVYKRQFYQGLYVDALVRLAEIYELRVDYMGAIRLYEQATEIETSTEKLYRQIILCWGRLGRRDMMKSTYEKLVRQLQNDIQMKPSRQMQDFYNSLIQDSDD